MLIRMQRAKITSVCCQALVLTQSSQQFRKIPSASTSLYIPENHGAQKLSKLLKFFWVNKYTGAQVFQLRSLRANLRVPLPTGTLASSNSPPLIAAFRSGGQSLVKVLDRAPAVYFKDHKNCTLPEVSGGLGRARVWNHSSLLPPEEVRWPEPQLSRSTGERSASRSREGPPTGPAPPHSRLQVPGEEGAGGTHLRPPGPPGSHRAYLGDPARACAWRA